MYFGLYRFALTQSDMEYVNKRTVVAMGLTTDVTREIVEELFIQMGPVVHVDFINSEKNLLDKEKFAFIEFEHMESVQFACDCLHGIPLFGRPIKVVPHSQKVLETVEDALKVLSLAEYKAQLKNEEQHFNTRKAGEGQDSEVHVKFVPLKKDEIQKVGIEEEKSRSKKKVKNAKADLTHLLTFTPEIKAKKGAGAERREKLIDQRPHKPIPNNNEFPTLGATKKEEFPALGAMKKEEFPTLGG